MTGPGAIHGIATANLGCEAGARVACEGGRSLVPSVCLEGMPMLADFCGKFGEFPKLDQPCIIYIYTDVVVGFSKDMWIRLFLICIFPNHVLFDVEDLGRSLECDVPKKRPWGLVQLLGRLA